MNVEYPDVETKLATARTRLILDKPFLGALVLRLPMVEGNPDWCETTFSDGKTFYYNRDYIDALDTEQTQFALSHEALHCALSHFHRRGHRIKHRWSLACDFAVNPLLIKDGLKPTPDAMYLREYEGMTAEEIYPCLEHDDNVGERDQNDDDNGADKSTNKDAQSGSANEKKCSEQQKDSQPDSARSEQTDAAGGKHGTTPPPMSETELESLSTQWQQRLAAAAQLAIQSGKLEGDMARMVDHLLQPKLPWRMLLARYFTATARDDYSYVRPSTRRGGPAVYPSLRSHQVDVVVAVDSSGSISENEINEFISEIDAIKSHIRARITLLCCDSKLNDACPWFFEQWDAFKFDVALRGGGGTSFRPVFDWVAAQDKAPDAVVYFTDADGVFPEIEPTYPVVWLVKGKSAVPFGERIQLN